MGISWSYRHSAEEEDEFPFSFLNRSPHFTSRRSLNRNSANSIRRSGGRVGGGWNWRDLLHMSSDDTGAAASSSGQRPSADSDHDDQNDESIATLLSSLIRSGQVRLITADSLYAADDDTVTSGGFGSDNEDLSGDRAGSNDATGVKMNEIRTMVELDSGKFSLCRSAAAGRRKILNRLRDRECGGMMRRSTSSVTEYFTQADKCYISNHMLPNVMSKIDTYRSKAFCGQYTTDGRVLITACQDQRIRFYDVTNRMDTGCSRSRRTETGSATTPGSGSLFHTVEAKDVGWSILDVAISPDGRHAVYSSWSDYIHQCSVYDGQDSNHLAFHMHPGEYRFCIFSLHFSADGNEILAGASDRCLYVYDRQRNARTLKIEAHEDDVNAVCFADDTSQIIYSGGDDGVCKVWDRRALSEENPTPVGLLAGHSDGVTFIDSKCDARYLVSNSKDQSIKLWDIRRFSTDDGLRATRAAVAKQSWDYRWQNVPRKVLKYRRLEGDTSVMTYRDHHTVLHTLIRCFFSPAFTTGQRYIYTGCASGACVVYDLLTGALVKRLKGHHACVRDVSWHPYRNEICSASWDAVVARWTFDGRSDSDIENESSCSDSDDSSDDMENNTSGRRAGSSRQTAAGRLVSLYRRRQAPLRRSERLREQEHRRVQQFRRMTPAFRVD